MPRDATATNSDSISIKYLMKLIVFEKCLSMRRKKSWAIFDRTFLLKGGLNQIMFLRRFLF